MLLGAMVGRLFFVVRYADCGLLVCFKVLKNVFNGSFSVHGRRNDASCVAGSFSARIESLQLRMLSVLASGDAYRRRSAAFYSQKGGFGCVESAHLSIEIFDCLLQTFHYEWRQLFV